MNLVSQCEKMIDIKALLSGFYDNGCYFAEIGAPGDTHECLK
jgi:hypothetical protein